MASILVTVKLFAAIASRNNVDMKKYICGIYIVNATPITSLIEETLTDGSHVYNIAIGEQEIPCMSCVVAYQALDEIAAAFKKATSEFVFVT